MGKKKGASSTSNTAEGEKDVDVQQESQPLLQHSTPEPGQSSTEKSPTPLSQKSTKKNSPQCRQAFLGMIVALPSIPCGMSLGFSAISLDQIELTVDEASWYTSVLMLAFPVGCLAAGQLMDRKGRRPALLTVTVLSLIGWLLLAVPTEIDNLLRLILGRIITGLAGGMAIMPAAAYAAECLSLNDRNRSSVVAWSTVALSLGIFIVYLFGSLISYTTVASIATVISILALVLVAIFIPESPAWLTSKGRYGDAEWAQRDINITPVPTKSPDPEQGPSGSTDEQPTPSNEPPRTLQDLKKPEVYRPLLIMTGFLLFQQLSGVYVMIAYMVDMVRAAGVITLNAYKVTILGGIVILLMSILASSIYPKTGVRAIAALSGAGTAITMLLIGLFLSLRSLWFTHEAWYFLNWIPFFFVLSNIGASTMGFLILPWSMLGEVFPLNVKGLAGGIATCAGFLFSFLALKIYPYIQLELGVSGVFFFFGFMAFLGTIFVIAFLPETRGKTLDEIVQGFTNKKK